MWISVCVFYFTRKIEKENKAVVLKRYRLTHIHTHTQWGNNSIPYHKQMQKFDRSVLQRSLCKKLLKYQFFYFQTEKLFFQVPSLLNFKKEIGISHNQKSK